MKYYESSTLDESLNGLKSNYTSCVFLNFIHISYLCTMKKRRINITIDQEMHQKAKFWAVQEGKSLSEKIETLLTLYCQSKTGVNLNEPIEPYFSEDHLQNNILISVSKLTPEKQIQVLEFTEFLLMKHLNTEKPTLKGLLKGQIYISSDFDAPMADFKDYMP